MEIPPPTMSIYSNLTVVNGVKISKKQVGYFTILLKIIGKDDIV